MFQNTLPFIAVFLFIVNIAQSQTCTVNAGIPFSLCETDGTEWTLFGNTNDPGGLPVPVTWTVLSEPAGSSVSITTPNSEVTTVTNVTVVGDYIFQLSGTCPDGSGIATNTVKYKLEAEIGDPMLSTTNLQACNEGWIGIGNFQSDVNYTWVAMDFPTSSNGIIQMTPSPSNDSVRLWTYLNIAGGTGKVILYSQRNSCIRTDTVDVTVCGDIPADAGADVNICGDSWVKVPEYFNPLEADEYRYMGVCGTQTWTQLSGPNSSTITYNPMYDNYWDGQVTWTNLVPGTYDFELEFNFGAPCNTVTKDTVTFFVGSGGECQNFFANRKVYTLCDDADSLYIDLVYDFGLDPNQLRPGDSIIWSISSNPNCAGMPAPPPPNTLIFAIHRDDICDPCDYFVTIQCEEGCADAVEIEVAHQEIDLTSTDRYYCTTDGSFVSINTQSLFQVGAQCHQAGLGIEYEVISSPTLAPGTRYNNISSVPPLGLGEHIFQLAMRGSSGYPLNDDGSCHETAIATAYIQGAPTSANAGTDAILPCNMDSVILSANDPSLPVDLDVTGTWSIISGPPGATFSDVNHFSPTLNGLILDETYCLKWSVGNNACGFLEDIIKVYTSSAPPVAPNAGPDSTVCHTNCITLFGDPMAGGVSGMWTVTPAAGITISDPTSPTSEVCGLAASTAYTFTWTGTNGCGTSSDDVIITTNSITGQSANAGPDLCTSSSSSNFLAADPAIAGATGTWSVLCTKGGITSTSVFIFDVNDPATSFSYNNKQGSIVFLWSISVPGCGITTDTVIFTREFGTPFILSEGFCGGPGTYDIDWSYYVGPGWIFDTVNYQGQAGVQFLTDATTAPAQVYLPADGQYIFYRKTGYGDCPKSGSISISLTDAPPVPDAGPDQIICSGNSFTLASGGGPYGGAWNQISGPTPNANIVDPSDPNTAVNSAWGPGIYEFAWNSFPSDSTTSACMVPDTVQIVVLNTNLGLGADLSYCEFRDVILTASNFTGVGTMDWTVSGPMMPTIDSLTVGYNIRLSDFTLPGSYTVTYTVTVPGCPPVSEDMIINFLQPIADAGTDVIACTDTANLSAIAATEMQWSAIQGTGSFVGTTDTSAIAMYYPILYGDTVSFVYCITENGCENCDTVQVIGAAVSDPSFNLTNITTCMGMDGQINLVGLESSTTYDLYYMLDSVQQGPISISADAMGNYSIAGLGDGTYSDIYVENEFSCTSGLLGPISLSSLCTQDLGNYVWEDLDSDGVQDTGEPGVDSVIVYLYEDTDMDGVPDGPPIDSTVTTGGGYYIFPDLFDGSYVLEFDLTNVPGYSFTSQDMTADSLDSDVNNLGTTETITLCCGEDDMTVDAGISEILPISLAYFKLEELNCNEISLKWGTAYEENTSHFIIEQQLADRTFIEVGRLNASGNSTSMTHYQFTHLVTNSETTYFRVKSVDFNGVIQLFPTVSFKSSCKESIKAIFPNPTFSQITVLFNHEVLTAGSQLELVDALGRQVAVYLPKEKDLKNGYTLDLSNVSAGIYFIKVRNNSYYSKAYKIIKVSNVD